MILTLKDAEWINNSFMIPTYAKDEAERKRWRLTTADFKFTDTTLGGNMYINTPPQFTRFADIKRQGRYASNANPTQFGSKGMGRYYSEAIDDNAQIVHFRCGVPAFNSMTQFFTSFYDPGTGYLSNTGRVSQFFFNVGRVAGFVVSLIAWPVTVLGKFVSYLANNKTSKYYYLKPAMPLYWNAVNTICNSIAANLGIVPRVHNYGTVRMDTADQVSQTELSTIHRMNPDIFREKGGIDIYKVANKAQRLADQNRKNLTQKLEDSGIGAPTDFTGTNTLIRENLRNFLNTLVVDKGNVAEENKTNTAGGAIVDGIDAYLERYIQSGLGQIPEGDGVNKPEDSSAWGMLKEAGDLLLAESRDGSDFVSFKVDYTGPTSESFSNSARESEIQSMLNGIASGNRSKRFTFMDGNVSDNPAMKLIEGIGDVVKNAMAGTAYELGLGGLMALSGRGIIDIPKHWDSSSANLPRMDYTIELRSPYGNKLSMFQNLYVPLACILAMGLPLSTGKQSYTSPFLVEVYSKGRASCRLGLIDSISISRGTGNMGWTENDEALGIDVTLSVMDLSSIMHMPINAGISALDGVVATATGVAGGAADAAASMLNVNTDISGAAQARAIGLNPKNWDEDNAFTDYMAVLGSLGLADMIYGSNRANLRATQRMLEFKSWRSISHFSSWINGTLPGRMIGIFTQQGSRTNP